MATTVITTAPGAADPLVSHAAPGIVEALPAYGFTTAAYVVAAVLFILSLGGLSGQESAKRAIWYGIVGMGLAVVATLFGPGAGNWLLSLIMIAIGGTGGLIAVDRLGNVCMPFNTEGMYRGSARPGGTPEVFIFG